MAESTATECKTTLREKPVAHLEVNQPLTRVYVA